MTGPERAGDQKAAPVERGTRYLDLGTPAIAIRTCDGERSLVELAGPDGHHERGVTPPDSCCHPDLALES